jgi:methylmalonyl-CoA mutase cobalamin-binding subunit
VSHVTTQREQRQKVAALKKAKVTAVPISILDEKSMKEVQKILNKVQEVK